MNGTAGIKRQDRPLRIGMILYGPLAHDSRVRREATTLARAGHQVRVVCLSGTEGAAALSDGVEVIVLKLRTSRASPVSATPYTRLAGSRLLRPVRRARWVFDYAREVTAWGQRALRAVPDVDVWHANDLPGLAAIAPALRSGIPVVYDSHEIFVDAGTAATLPAPVRRLLRAYERRLVLRVAAVITVCDPFAQVLRRRYHPRRLVVVYNAPPRWESLTTAPDALRRATGLSGGTPIVLYHGVFAADRGLRQLAEAMLTPGLEGTHLAFLGFGPMTEELTSMAADPRFQGRVHVLPGVPPSELLGWVASADVVAVPILPSTLNHRLTTPNKLLEALAVGVPVVVSDSPGMAPIVLTNPGGPLGATCDPWKPDSIGEAILSIVGLDPSDMARLRARCLAAAHERWNWETESAKLVDLYATL